MQVFLEAIKFNHDPKFATNDAFNIRRNETEVVQVPEWRRGVSVKPEDSPAAYARDALAGRHPTIRAKLSFLDFDPAIKSVWIRALDSRLDPGIYSQTASSLQFELLAPGFQHAHADNVLGSVIEREVNLQGGEEFELFNLDNARINSAGVTVNDIIWRWQYRTSSTGWQDFATTTHRIYTVLKLPTDPWHPESQDATDTQKPWTEVLDYACRWAASAVDVDEAATLVTLQVNRLGRGLVQYDNHHSGSTGFTLDDPDSFDCGDFLLLLRGQPNQHGSGVNCDDCSAFVASFANILGCSLSEAEMDHDFPLHPHLRIGAAAPETDEFSYHAVAWSGACGVNDKVFDACLQLDSDDDPATSPHPWFVPTNIRFGTPEERFYRFRLTRSPNECNPVQGSAIRRRIGFPKLKPEMAAAISALMKRESVPAAQDTTSLVFSNLVSKMVSGADEFSFWELQNLDFLEGTDSLLSTQSFWRRKDQADITIRIDAYAAASVHQASEKLKKLLSRFQLRHIKQEEHPKFGDVVHSVPEKFVIVFSRHQFVFRLRNVGKRVISCEAFAEAIDDLLISQFESQINWDRGPSQ
jgi:hypothetical protein